MQKPKSAGQSGDTHSVIKPVKNFGLLCRSLSLGGLALALSACAAQDISLSAPLVQTESVDARAQQLLDKMTLQEKVGQVLQADIAAVTPEEVKRYNLGSVLNGGNSAPG